MDKRMAQDAALEGTVSYRVWLERFTEEWNEPDRILMEAATDERTLMAWYSVPAEVMEQMKAADPQGYAAAKKIVDGIEKKRKLSGQSAESQRSSY